MHDHDKHDHEAHGHGAHHDLAMHHDMGLETDPVCGMSVDPAKAGPAGLTLDHEGKSYYFCGKGCLLEFRDDPEHYLDPNYAPTM